MGMFTSLSSLSISTMATMTGAHAEGESSKQIAVQQLQRSIKIIVLFFVTGITLDKTIVT